MEGFLTLEKSSAVVKMAVGCWVLKTGIRFAVTDISYFTADLRLRAQAVGLQRRTGGRPGAALPRARNRTTRTPGRLTPGRASHWRGRSALSRHPWESPGRNRTHNHDHSIHQRPEG